MIRYALTCDSGHEFEAWFRSSDTFEALAASGEVSCAICGSVSVTKAPMTPALGRGRKGASKQAAASSDPVPAPRTDNAPDLAKLRAKIEAVSEDVGRRFAAEARAIHEGEAPARPILGEATAEEARSLAEDRIPAVPLPWWQRRDD